MPHACRSLLSLLLCLVATAPVANAQSIGRPVRHVRLFEASTDNAAQFELNAAALGQVAEMDGPVLVPNVAIRGDESVDLLLERFEVTSPSTQFVLGDVMTPTRFDPSRVTLLRGSIVDQPDSHVFLAVSDLGAAGTIELGAGAERYVLTGAAGGKGLARGALAFVPSRGFTGPPGVEICDLRVPDGFDPGGGVAGGTTIGMRHLELAVDTDYEFYELFGDSDAANAYIIALYGVVSDIYMRDVSVHIELTFVRLWDEPNDPYDADDPFGSFASEWNDNMGAVERDVAQLLTGRRNLPYGGVASLSALCSSSGYSVNGYLNGSFADPAVPSSGNWDIVVVSHELGHNCGTLHTHSYDIDNCAGGDVQRGTIMSYCHIVSGGVSNIDIRFHTGIQPHITGFVGGLGCVPPDCNQNNVADSDDIANGDSDDFNKNGVPDECEDCNENGMLDDLDIALAISLDVNGNGIPDECEPDCNDNNTPDSMDIQLGTSVDLYGDGVPDECQADCNDNGQADYNEIQANMSLDVDRNAVLDACQDCDDDGTTDFDVLAGGLNLWAAGSDLQHLIEFNATSGAPVKQSSSGMIGTPRDVIIGPDGMVYVSHELADAVARFDPVTGGFIDEFIGSGSGGLSAPGGMTFGPNGSLFIVSRASASVLEFDGASGSFIGVFVAGGSGGLTNPHGIAFGGNGNLFVGSGDDRVLEYVGGTGAFAGEFVSAGSGGLDTPRGLLFKPDGNLLVASFSTDAVLEYDGATGAFIDQFDRGGLDSGFWGLRNPWALRMGPRGENIYVSSFDGNAAIHTYDVETGLFQRSYYVLAADIANPTGFAIVPPSPSDCNMNLFPDNCDIAQGVSSDVNGNGVPDECETTASPDLNGDGAVDPADLAILLGAWGPCPGCPADLNGDGVVDAADLAVLLGGWG